MKKEDILHLAAEEMQQDWSDLRFQDVFYKAYIQGATRVNSEVERLTSERDAALAEIERLKGIKPELPPFPSQGNGLPRYGIRWNSPTEPLTVPMDDGYWTPYHLAKAREAELAAQVEVARKLYVRLTNNVGFSDNGEGCYVADRKLMADFDSWSDATPTQCLREIQAEAVLNAVKFFSPARDVDVEALESYADRVKAGYE